MADDLFDEFGNFIGEQKEIISSSESEEIQNLESPDFVIDVNNI